MQGACSHSTTHLQSGVTNTMVALHKPFRPTQRPCDSWPRDRQSPLRSSLGRTACSRRTSSATREGVFARVRSTRAGMPWTCMRGPYLVGVVACVGAASELEPLTLIVRPRRMQCQQWPVQGHFALSLHATWTVMQCMQCVCMPCIRPCSDPVRRRNSLTITITPSTCGGNNRPANLGSACHRGVHGNAPYKRGQRSSKQPRDGDGVHGAA
jgi:hypothetical protein